MTEVNVQASGGAGFTGLLFLVFLVLKLTGYISWSWWWVTAPLWAPLLFVIGVLIIAAIAVAITGGNFK